MSRFGTLHLPPATDPGARAYKEWLHLNLFALDAEVVALMNVSLHGPPLDRRARSVAVALGSGADGEWSGGIEISGMTEARVEPQGIFHSTISLATAPDQTALLASVRRPDDGFVADIVARPCLPDIDLDLYAAFGSGWIGWAVMPAMELSGRLRLGDAEIGLEGATGYHDSNWGRWFWGEDIAWEWGTFVLAGGTVVVFARNCNRLHDHLGAAHVFLVHDGKVFPFAPDRISITFEESAPRPGRRLPGALAAIYPDRARPDLPGRITLCGESPTAIFELVFEARSTAQLILAEPTMPGTSWINEIAGKCSLVGQLNGGRIRRDGMGIFEYVE